MVNLRHVLLSAALSPYLRGWSKFKLSWFTFQLTDETFALHANRFAAGAQAQSTTFAINAISHLAWVGGTGLGVVAGGMVRESREHEEDEGRGRERAYGDRAADLSDRRIVEEETEDPGDEDHDRSGGHDRVD